MSDEIICPHCKNEFYESYEQIPFGANGEVTWVETCTECEKDFDVRFDTYNVNDGFSCKIQTCKDGEHNYIIKDECYKRNYNHLLSASISFYSRVEVCSICDDYLFTPVKEDGSDFTKKELTDFIIKRRLANIDKVYHEFKGVKNGEFRINNSEEIILSFKEEEGISKIWVKICRWLISKGFKTQRMPDYLQRRTISLKKDWLECDVSFHRYAIDISFYQNVILKNRKKGDGRYEFNRYDILDHTMKLKLRATLYMIKKYMISNRFTQKQEIEGYARVLNRLKINNFDEWTDPTNHHHRDYEDRDGIKMESGDEKYFYDGKILKKGIIWWNNGNQWYVLSNGDVYQIAHYKAFNYSGEPRRKPLSHDEQIQRLHSELTKAEKAHNYRRCEVLWNKLKDLKLYNVWSIEHGKWWGPNNCGYTEDKTKAGIYTYDNIMNNQSYYNGGLDSKAIEII